MQLGSAARAGVSSYPTWVIGGRTHNGMMSIQQLANIRISIAGLVRSD